MPIPNQIALYVGSSSAPERHIINVVKSIIVENENLSRQASMYFCHKYSGVKLQEIGNLFDVGETAIVEASRRFSLKMGEDTEDGGTSEEGIEIMNNEDATRIGSSDVDLALKHAGLRDGFLDEVPSYQEEYY